MVARRRPPGCATWRSEAHLTHAHVAVTLVQAEAPDHTSALQLVLGHLREAVSQHIEREVAAVGHRVVSCSLCWRSYTDRHTDAQDGMQVHGKSIRSACLVDADVENRIQEAAELAPLHNPANLGGIQAAARIFQGTPQV